MIARLALVLSLAGTLAGQADKRKEKVADLADGLPKLLKCFKMFRQDVSYHVEIRSTRITRRDAAIFEEVQEVLAPRPHSGPPTRELLEKAMGQLPDARWRVEKVWVQKIGRRIVQQHMHAVTLTGGAHGVATADGGWYLTYDADNNLAYLTWRERAVLWSPRAIVSPLPVSWEREKFLKNDTLWTKRRLGDGSVILTGTQKQHGTRSAVHITDSETPLAMSCAMQTDSGGTWLVSYFTYKDAVEPKLAIWLGGALYVAKAGKDAVRVLRFEVTNVRIAPKGEPQLALDLQPKTGLYDLRTSKNSYYGWDINAWPKECRPLVRIKDKAKGK